MASTNPLALPIVRRVAHAAKHHIAAVRAAKFGHHARRVDCSGHHRQQCRDQRRSLTDDRRGRINALNRFGDRRPPQVPPRHKLHRKRTVARIPDFVGPLPLPIAV
jgi:hypothetical protein